MAANPNHIATAPSLPALLRRFFTKYPPSIHSSLVQGSAIPPNRRAPRETLKPPSDVDTGSTISTTPPSDPNASMKEISSATPPPLSELHKNRSYNPFLPYRNPTTGRWRGAQIGLRRQADLFKLAAKHGVELLLPPSMKSSEYKRVRVEERGKTMRGTGEGQRVKGHKWERTLKGRLEERRRAMVGMGELVREWKERGHGRGWKKYPR